MRLPDAGLIAHCDLQMKVRWLALHDVLADSKPARAQIHHAYQNLSARNLRSASSANVVPVEMLSRLSPTILANPGG